MSSLTQVRLAAEQAREQNLNTIAHIDEQSVITLAKIRRSKYDVVGLTDGIVEYTNAMEQRKKLVDQNHLLEMLIARSLVSEYQQSAPAGLL